jgi:hypothetical protein
MMNNAIKLAATAAVLTIGFTAGTAQADAVDDGPCPLGSFAEIPAGSDYENNFWFDADGVLFGFAFEEDECWTSASKFAR